MRAHRVLARARLVTVLVLGLASALSPGGCSHPGAGNGGPSQTGGSPQGASGTGGQSLGGASSTGGASAGSSGTGGTVEVPKATYELIEDAEDGDGRIINMNGHQGPWHSFNSSSGGNQTPPVSGPFKAEAGGANNSGSAIHTTGDGYTYAGVGFDLNSTADMAESAQSMSFDASKFDGLVFYAKGTGKLRVEFPMKAFVPTASGGSCDSNCWNVYGDRSLQGTLTTSWQEYKIPFAKLAREMGDPNPAFDPSQLMGIAFKHEASDKFDFWIDDIRFYKDPAPGSGTTMGAGGKSGGAGGSSGSGGDPTMCTFNAQPYSSAGYTWYMFSQGTYKDPDSKLYQTACGYRSTAANAETVANVGTPQYFAAIASESDTNFSTKQYCGACAEIKNGGKTLIATIVDSCPRTFNNGSNPKCVDGHLDLSKAASDNLGLGGDVSGAPPWKIVPCPVTGNVVVRIKPGNSDQVYIENEVLPLQSVVMNGQMASRLSYGAWQLPGDAAGATLTLTDIAGRSIDVKVTGSAAGQDQDTGTRFAMCK